MTNVVRGFLLELLKTNQVKRRISNYIYNVRRVQRSWRNHLLRQRARMLVLSRQWDRAFLLMRSKGKNGKLPDESETAGPRTALRHKESLSSAQAHDAATPACALPLQASPRKAREPQAAHVPAHTPRPPHAAAKRDSSASNEAAGAEQGNPKKKHSVSQESDEHDSKRVAFRARAQNKLKINVNTPAAATTATPRGTHGANGARTHGKSSHSPSLHYSTSMHSARRATGPHTPRELSGIC